MKDALKDRFNQWLLATDQGLIIAPRNMHDILLNWLGEAPLKQIQIMDEKEWLFAHGAQLDPRLNGRLMERFNFTPDVVRELMQVLRHIDEPIEDERLKLVMDFCVQERLITKPPWAHTPLSPSLCLIDIYETPLIKHRLETIYSEASILRLNADPRTTPVPYVAFENAYAEVESLAETISEVLLSGEAINAVKIHATQPEYHDLMAVIFPRYHLPFQRVESKPFSSTALYQTLIQIMETSKTWDEIERAFKKTLTHNAATAWLVQPVSKAILDVKDHAFDTA